MKQSTQLMLEDLITRCSELKTVRNDIDSAFELLKQCFSTGNHLYICGNGGSASDAQHIVGELMKSFVIKRKINESLAKNLRQLYPEDADMIISGLQGALPAHTLAGETALLTAFMNDVDPVMVFAQQLSGYMKPDDVLMAITTSGSSLNVIRAIQVATAMGGKTIALTGRKGLDITVRSDVTIAVPQAETYKVQELHLPVYHSLCEMLENEFFGSDS